MKIKGFDKDLNGEGDMIDFLKDGVIEQKPGFSINDDGKAEWAVRKIAEAKEEKQRMADFYKSQLEAITSRCDQTIEYMQSLLFEYFSSVPRKATKTGIEKYALPSATLQFKPAAIDYARDEDKLLEWARSNNPDFVKVTEQASWSDIKEYIKETGELPDGVTPIEKPGKFEVKING